MGRWGALRTPVRGRGGEGGRHLLPGPITHAGKILSDYEARAWIPTYGRSCREEGKGGGRYLRWEPGSISWAPTFGRNVTESSYREEQPTIKYTSTQNLHNSAPQQRLFKFLNLHNWRYFSTEHTRDNTTDKLIHLSSFCYNPAKIAWLHYNY